MFARIFAVASLVALVVASPAPIAARNPCSNGAINCCNSVQQASQLNSLFSQFGFGDILAGVVGQVGLQCNPIDVIALGGNSCTQQTVCCSGNTFNGLVQTGCTPINLNA